MIMKKHNNILITIDNNFNEQDMSIFISII